MPSIRIVLAIFVVALLTLSGILATVPSAQEVAAKQSTDPSSQFHVVAVSGCLAQDEDNWLLIGATPPLVEPRADEDSHTGSGFTVQKANAQPAGKERYRLMGLLHEFGVEEHLGHKVLVKGLLLGAGEERRINLVSFEFAAQECLDEK